MALPDAAWATRTGKGRAAVHGIRGFGEEDHADIGWIAFDGAVGPGKPATLGVLLYPFPDRRPDVRIRRVGGAARAAHFAIDHPDGTDHLLFGAPDREHESENIRFAGACALIRYRAGRPAAWAAVRATRLLLGERILLDAPAPQDAEGAL